MKKKYFDVIFIVERNRRKKFVVGMIEKLLKTI
jgi:hypothetical protein